MPQGRSHALTSGRGRQRDQGAGSASAAVDQVGQAAQTQRVTTQVKLYEAKTKLSDLVERAVNGEDIVIAKSGRPRVRLVPVVERTGPRRSGALKGQIWFGPG